MYVKLYSTGFVNQFQSIAYAGDTPRDTIPPVVSICPSDVYATSSCNTANTTQVIWQEPIATDNSGMATLQSQTHQSGQYFSVGSAQVTYIFADLSGNVASCIFSVTVTPEGNQSMYADTLLL